MPANWFSKILLNWHKNNFRILPWKSGKNPYYIWLSEIILQQTRVEQGLPYYIKFIEAFPTIFDLAKADESKVLKLWEGLGYYNRAQNLHQTAKFVSSQLNGKFPDQYEDLLKLKGIGPYTAAAISSFAYNHPYAVVDGNVFRVLSRVHGINTPIDSTSGKKEFTKTANHFLDPNNPADYNQAIMDFGATICTPKKPKCTHCPFEKNCYALKHQEIEKLPVKAKKIVKKSRYLYYFVFIHENEIAIRKRNNKDIWKHLFEFFLEETNTPTKNPIDLIKNLNLNFLSAQTSPIYFHKLTHRNLEVSFTSLLLNERQGTPHDMIYIKTKNLSKFAFPKVIHCFFEDNPLILKDSF